LTWQDVAMPALELNEGDAYAGCPRQIEVALELADGGTNRAIARRLAITEETLRKHLEHIYRALGVTDRASAIARIRGW
jgi:DNA-binding NarL/FixJ family response regulator